MTFQRFLLVLGMMALLAGVGLLAYWLSRPAPPTVEAPKVVLATILVAAKPIAAGSLLRAEDIRWKQVPAETVAAGWLRQGEIADADLIGAVVRQGFEAGEPLIAGQVIKPTESGFLAAVLAPGCRAVSIDVDAAEANAGLIAPGDRVDVILTQSFETENVPPPARSVGETVLRNLRVVAVGQDISAATRPLPAERAVGGAELRVPKTMTLEVANTEAEALLVAAQLGKVHLALLSLEKPATPEAAVPPPASIWAGDVSPALRSSLRQPPPAAPAVASAPRAPAGIEIQLMRGQNLEQRCFGKDGMPEACGSAPASP